ncbi:MAG: DNA polymerase III subunit alpha, partial [Solobacterium sp.]|nr:DNA polymerase III subunit alpha [Solobacterium sp.]
ERISMPDIDTDFPDDRRDEVVAYVKEKYGKDHVGHIITYGTLKTKQVLRDVARVLKYTTVETDSIAKLIPNSLNTSLMDAYNTIPLFNQKINSDKKYQFLFEIALKLEGNPRHESTHAAGIVFSKNVLSDVVPMISIESDLDSTQYSAEYLEDLGLIKMDFLGLRNLGIIAEIMDDINPKFDINRIPLNDKKTFELISNVNLLGVFQLESNGMQNLARRMRPNSFEELSMMIALFRPGPMENIPAFLENRAHRDRIKYLTKELEPILKETYGIIVYQEQIMSIARKLANFSYGKADVLRRAMSKKKAKELEKLKPEFIDGCLKNGYDISLANELYELILRFANYGFNKSHSIAYGLVAYRMAYLKANYPLYFYKALLNGAIGASEKTYAYIKEIRGRNIGLLGLSINKSTNEYQIVDDKILLPLSICKDVGSANVSKIMEAKPFTSYVDAICKLTEEGVDIKALTSLIASGAFDEFGLSRYSMALNLSRVIQYANSTNGLNLFGGDDAPIIENHPDDMMVLASKEKEVLGFYFKFDPIERVKQKYHISVPSISEIKMGSACGFGQIVRIKQIRTKKGQRMCFVDVNDESASISLAVMPNIYDQYIEGLNKAHYVYFEGKKERESSLLVRKMVLY